jgi:hypothetical protein
MHKEKPYKRVLARIDTRATAKFNLRLRPEMRSFIEAEAQARKVSMTKIALLALKLLYTSKRPSTPGALRVELDR